MFYLLNWVFCQMPPPYKAIYWKMKAFSPRLKVFFMIIVLIPITGTLLEHLLWGRVRHAPSPKNPQLAIRPIGDFCDFCDFVMWSPFLFSVNRSPHQPLLCILGHWFRIWPQEYIFPKRNWRQVWSENFENVNISQK